MIEEKFWERRENFLRINPSGTVPVLVRKNESVIIGSTNIVDYIIARHQMESETDLIPMISSHMSGEEEFRYTSIKNLCVWFDEKFATEVVKPLLYEKIVNFFRDRSIPDPNYLSAARYNLGIHVEYLEHLLSQHEYLCGEKFTLADLVASCHISVVDYLGEIVWSKMPYTRNWYSIIKSKPYFKEFLKERIGGFPPPKHYNEFDF